MSLAKVIQRWSLLIALVAVALATTVFVLVSNAEAETEDWPPFTMVYEVAGPTTTVGGIAQPSIEVHRYEYRSKTDWEDTIMEAPSIQTDYGDFSPVGSYRRLKGQLFTEYDATDDLLEQSTISEGVMFVPNGVLVPFQNRAIELTTGLTPDRVSTSALVCFQNDCSADATGLLYVLEDSSEYIFADDSRGFPLKAGDFLVVKELRIHDTRR